jgi:hypothetical protein
MWKKAWPVRKKIQIAPPQRENVICCSGDVDMQ